MNTSLLHHSARREIKFLFTKLNELIPTNADCYLTACNGSYCIIDRYRPPLRAAACWLNWRANATGRGWRRIRSALSPMTGWC